MNSHPVSRKQTNTQNTHRFEPRPGAVRPPALVTEYLGAGSLRGAVVRKADFLKSNSVRIKLALDTARVSKYTHKIVCAVCVVCAQPVHQPVMFV